MPARKLPALLQSNRLLKTFWGRVIPSAARNLLLTLEHLRDPSSTSPYRHDGSHQFFRSRLAAGLLCRPGAKTNAGVKPPLPRKSGCAQPIIKNTHNYRFFYGMNPIAIENKPLAKKRTQSNPINFRIFRRFLNQGRHAMGVGACFLGGAVLEPAPAADLPAERPSAGDKMQVVRRRGANVPRQTQRLERPYEGVGQVDFPKF